MNDELERIKYKTCQWIGEHAHGPGLCSSATVPGRNYCEEHLWRVYQKGTGLGRRKKDQKTADSVNNFKSLVNEVVQELEDEGVI